jgi:hypothetical protein
MREGIFYDVIKLARESFLPCLYTSLMSAQGKQERIFLKLSKRRAACLRERGRKKGCERAREEKRVE